MPTNFPSAIPSTVDSWDYLLSTTLYAYKNVLTDNVFKKTPLLEFLKDRMQTEEGGYTIVRPIMSQDAFSADVAFYEMYDAINPTEDTRGITSVEYRWRQFVGSLALSGIERHRNKGQRQAINLLKAKLTQLEKTMAAKLNVVFYADPAGGSKDYNGLEAIVGTGNPTRANLGGVNATTNTFWRSKVDTTAEALSLTKMSNIYNSASLQGEQPGRIFTTQALWEKYESLLQPQLRYSDAKTADAGFQNLLYKGVAVVFDPDCPSGTMYFLNANHLYLVKNGDVWMKNSGFFTRPDRDQENRYAQIVSYGELITDNRQVHGKLTNKT